MENNKKRKFENIYKKNLIEMYKNEYFDEIDYLITKNDKNNFIAYKKKKINKKIRSLSF